MAGIMFRPAAARDLPLLIGLTSGTGGGKTFSGLRISRGIAQAYGRGEKFAVVDTENRRASHYASLFRFDVMDMEPPFHPERFLEAINAAAKAGYPVVMIDSMSHEHNGPGGILDLHEAEVIRMAGEGPNPSYKRREAVKMAAWIQPKRRRLAMIQGILQAKIAVVFCFRGKQPIEMGDDDDRPAGDARQQAARRRTKVTRGEFQPISGDELPYEMAALLVLSRQNPGAVDLSQPNKIGEPVKHLIRDGVKLDEAFGRAMAEWARGEKAPDSEPMRQPTSVGPGPHPDIYVLTTEGKRLEAKSIADWTDAWMRAVAARQEKKDGAGLEALRDRNSQVFEALRPEFPDEVDEVEQIIAAALASLQQGPAQ